MNLSTIKKWVADTIHFAGFKNENEEPRLNIEGVIESAHIEESIADTTNVANATYYPSSTGKEFGPYKNLSLTGKLIDGAAETTTLTLEATNDEDTANADWIQIYGYDPKNNIAVNNHFATNETKTFTWDFDNFNYRYLRLKITTSAATNTVIIKMRRSN
jgi:hypothetical protein